MLYGAMGVGGCGCCNAGFVVRRSVEIHVIVLVHHGRAIKRWIIVVRAASVARRGDGLIGWDVGPFWGNDMRGDCVSGNIG